MELSLKDYFTHMEFVVNGDIGVDELTDFFTTQPYSQTKPYLTRRQLIPTDKRFQEIELVYEDLNKVTAVIWELSISLSELMEIFGKPSIRNELHTDSTAFLFKSSSKNITGILTRHPEWLIKRKKTFEYKDERGEKIEFTNPMFSFVQFNFEG